MEKDGYEALGNDGAKTDGSVSVPASKGFIDPLYVCGERVDVTCIIYH